MTQDKNRLIIAKGIAAMFDLIDTIGFSTHDSDAYTGNAELKPFYGLIRRKTSVMRLPL
jgi:hypothetical protein